MIPLGRHERDMMLPLLCVFRNNVLFLKHLPYEVARYLVEALRLLVLLWKYKCEVEKRWGKLDSLGLR